LFENAKWTSNLIEQKVSHFFAPRAPQMVIKSNYMNARAGWSTIGRQPTTARTDVTVVSSMAGLAQVAYPYIMFHDLFFCYSSFFGQALGTPWLDPS